MMRLYELHMALAGSIGDPVSYIPTGITKDEQFEGAVRYSAFMRDSYLKRAMSKIYSDVVMALTKHNGEVRAERLSTFFPTSTKLLFGNIIMGSPTPYVMVPDLFYAYGLMLRFKYFAPFLRGYMHGSIGPTSTSDMHYIGGINVPIVNSQELASKAGRHTVQSNEPLAHIIGYNQSVPNVGQGTFIHFVSNNFTTEMANMIANHGQQSVAYELTYLPQAPDTHTLAHDDEVMFEQSYIGEIIRYATYFALVDSEDMTQTEAAQLLNTNRFNLFEYPEQGMQ